MAIAPRTFNAAQCSLAAIAMALSACAATPDRFTPTMSVCAELDQTCRDALVEDFGVDRSTFTDEQTNAVERGRRYLLVEDNGPWPPPKDQLFRLLMIDLFDPVVGADVREKRHNYSADRIDTMVVTDRTDFVMRFNDGSGDVNPKAGDWTPGYLMAVFRLRQATHADLPAHLYIGGDHYDADWSSAYGIQNS